MSSDELKSSLSEQNCSEIDQYGHGNDRLRNDSESLVDDLEPIAVGHISEHSSHLSFLLSDFNAFVKLGVNIKYHLAMLPCCDKQRIKLQSVTFDHHSFCELSWL